MQSDSIIRAVTDVIVKTPQWLRQDLASNLPNSKQRAEETLIAMILSALGAAAPNKP
jgi:hypothetical protein